MVLHYEPETKHRIMVCITPQTNCIRLIDKASEKAKVNKGEFCVVYVNKDNSISQDLQQYKILQELFEYAQSKGGRIAIIAGTKVSSALADFAKENKVIELIVGKSDKTEYDIKNKKDVLNPLMQKLTKENVFIDVVG